MWSDTHRPTRVEQMLGNEDARIAVAKWLSMWVNGSKPLLLIGPPGVGKTTLVKALANQLNYDLIEMNASDTRNKEVLTNRIMAMLKNESLLGKKTLLFLDEVDGISGKQDAGGMESLLTMIKEPTLPIIMAANNRHSKLKILIKVSKLIEFNKIRPSLLLLYLNHVLKKERKDIDRNEKISIINNSYGDVRSLLNIAQSKFSGYDAIRDRSFEIDISKAIDIFFSSTSPEEAKESLMSLDGGYPDPRFGQSPEEKRKDIIYALFASIVSSEIDKQRLGVMLDVLSKADVIVGRVAEKRHWTLLKYLSVFIAYGLFDKAFNKGIKYSQYSLSWTITGPIFARGQALRNLLSYFSKKTHTSRSTFGSLYLPYLMSVLVSRALDSTKFVEALDLDVKSGEALSQEMERVLRG